MNFERQLFARFASSEEAIIDKKIENLYIKYKKAKDQFES